MTDEGTLDLALDALASEELGLEEASLILFAEDADWPVFAASVLDP